MVVVRGTCSACASYKLGQCQAASSSFRGRSLWGIACVACGSYRKDGEVRVSDAPVVHEAPVRR